MTVSHAVSALKVLEAEHEGLLGFLYMCPVGVVQAGADGTIRLINPHAAQLLLPLVPSRAIDNLFKVLEGCAPDLRNLTEALAAERGLICQGYQIVLGGSGPGPRVLSCSLLKIGADCLMAVLQDVTTEVEQERQLKQNEALFAALAAGVKDFALLTLDIHGKIDTWNTSGTRQTGFEAAAVLGRDMDVLCHVDGGQTGRAAEQIVAAAHEGWSLREARCVRRDGQRYWCQILVSAREGEAGTIVGYSVVMRDVTERRMTGDEIRRLLTTDHLTGAANRAHFFTRAEAGLGRHVRTGKPFSVIMLDVDHFKSVNDIYGHATGDGVLRALVRCCRACLQEDHTLARLGGEEFAVLLPDADLAGAVRIAERMRQAASTQLGTLDGQPVGATISLGCAEMTEHVEGIDALLRAADEALYNAKRAGRNRVMAAPRQKAPAVAAV